MWHFQGQIGHTKKNSMACASWPVDTAHGLDFSKAILEKCKGETEKDLAWNRFEPIVPDFFGA